MLSWKKWIAPHWFGSFRRKVKSAFKAKFAKGQRIFAYVPIGCRKDPEEKCHLLIAEDTRWIIEKIYALAVRGVGAAKTSKVLTQEKGSTPGWLNYQRKGTFANIYANAPEGKAYAWTIAQVKSILEDETYIENSVHYRETNISNKNKKRIRKDPSEWVRVEGTHEVIISKDVFDRVQEQIATRRRYMKDQTTQIFSRPLKCAGCGWSMRFRTKRQIKKPYRHYDCSRYGQLGNQCSAHYVRYDVLYPYVLSRLQFWIKAVHQNEKAIAARLLKPSNSGQEAKHRRAAADKKRAEKRPAALDSLIARIYEDRTAEVMTARNFSMLSQKYQQEQKALETKILALNTQLEAAREQTETLKNGLFW